jgi:hypothetical protein
VAVKLTILGAGVVAALYGAFVLIVSIVGEAIEGGLDALD